MSTLGTARDLFRPARLEVEKRPIRETKLDVIEANPGSELTFPGTVTVFIAHKGSGALERVRAAARHGAEESRKLKSHLHSQYEKHQPMSIEEYAQHVIHEPVFADIRYGGAVLNSGVYAPEGLDVVFVLIPYNGGRLAHEGFTLAEHYLEGSNAALEGLAVLTEPPLTAAEKTALSQVAPDQLSRNVGFFDDCHTTWWAVAVVLVTLATITATCLCAYAAEQHIDEEEIKKLGPAASARALLVLRRRILEEARAKHGV